MTSHSLHKGLIPKWTDKGFIENDIFFCVDDSWFSLELPAKWLLTLDTHRLKIWVEDNVSVIQIIGNGDSISRFIPHSLSMRKLKYNFISRNDLNHIYVSYLLPITEIASVVWEGCFEQDSHTLQKIQNEAARLATG